MEFNQKAFLYILENKEFIEKNRYQLFECENKYKIIENFENNFEIEYFQLKKTLILFCIYGYEFNNIYLLHKSKINEIMSKKEFIDITNLNIYTNSLKYFIIKEKTEGVLFSHIIDFVCYYLGKYSDILFDLSEITDDNIDTIDTDDRMTKIIELLEILNDFFVLFDCKTNLEFI